MKIFELIEEMKSFLCSVADKYNVNRIWLSCNDEMRSFWKDELETSEEAAVYMASCFINFLVEENMEEEWNYLDKAVHNCIKEGSFGSVLSIFIEERNGNKTWVCK